MAFLERRALKTVVLLGCGPGHMEAVLAFRDGEEAVGHHAHLILVSEVETYYHGPILPSVVVGTLKVRLHLFARAAVQTTEPRARFPFPPLFFFFSLCTGFSLHLWMC